LWPTARGKIDAFVEGGRQNDLPTQEDMVNILIVCGEQRIESSVDEFLALNDLRDRKHFLACMKASEVYTGYGAQDIDYQVWPVVADGRARSAADHILSVVGPRPPSEQLRRPCSPTLNAPVANPRLRCHSWRQGAIVFFSPPRRSRASDRSSSQAGSTMPSRAAGKPA
jgi:hypothetical protein